MHLIPKIIHQTWKDHNIPEALISLPETWKIHHPDWEYILWTDEMNRAFIEKYFPSFLHTYDNYPANIQKVDAVRYFILLKMGGMFVDIDLECFKNIEPLLNDHTCLFGLEPAEHCRRFGKSKIICNAFMACIPYHDFFKFICTNIFDIPPATGHRGIDILESTGPFFLTRTYDNYKNQIAVKLLTSDTLYPLTIPESRMVINGDITDSIQTKVNAAYGVHYFLGNW